MIRKVWLLLTSIILCVIILIIGFILDYQRIIHFSYTGYAVDTHENLYVGEGNGIVRVGPNGEKSIIVTIYRGYAFAVVTDTLYVARGNTISTYTLGGDLIDEVRAAKYEIDHIYNSSWQAKSVNGKQYQATRFLGHVVIEMYTGDGQQVKYSLSIWETIYKWLCVFAFLGMLCSLVILLFCLNKHVSMKDQHIKSTQ